MRADDVKDFDGVEARIRERIQTRLIPDTAVSVRFEDLYPPMKATSASVSVAEHARRLYAEAGGALKVNQVSVGGGTDAAFAALRTTAPVLEGLGLRTFGAHSGSAEYVETASIEPRLYLVARLIMDVGDGKVTLPARGQTGPAVESGR
jgi:glutamate carboxypeptidase